MRFSHFIEQFVLKFFHFRRVEVLPLIVCMHDFENDSGYCSLNQSQFENLVFQFRSLGYRAGNLAEVLHALYNGSASPIVHFMFDDGCSGWEKLVNFEYVSFAVSQDPSIYRSSFNSGIFCNAVGRVNVVDHLNTHSVSIYSQAGIEKFYSDETRFRWMERRVIALPFGGEKELRNIFSELAAKEDFFLTTISRFRLSQIFKVSGLPNNNIFPRVSYYSGDTAKGLLNRNAGATNFLHRVKSWI